MNEHEKKGESTELADLQKVMTALWKSHYTKHSQMMCLDLNSKLDEGTERALAAFGG